MAKPLGMNLEAAALGILRVVNERMINGILEMTVRRGIDPRGLSLVTGGGATGVAAIELARELGITRIIVPRETSVLCALGAVNADLKWSNVTSVSTTVDTFLDQEVNDALSNLKIKGEKFLELLNVPSSRRRYELSTSARYPLQVTELDIPCPNTFIGNDDLKTISENFHTTYYERYSVEERENDIELVAWRLTAIGNVDAPKRLPPQSHEKESTVGKTRFFDTVSQSWQDAVTIDPDRMLENEIVTGPTLLVAKDTTIVVPTGYSAEMSAGGYLLITPQD